MHDWKAILGFGCAAGACLLVSCSAKDGTAPLAPRATLTVTLEGTGNVRSEPVGIDCPGTCSATFPVGARVALVASPAEGWKLTGFGEACAGTECAVKVSDDATIRVGFALVDARWNPAVGAGDCVTAWGTGGDALSVCDKVKDNYVVVNKQARNLAFCQRGKLTRNFRIGLGFTPAGTKVKQGDGKTPEGVFYAARLLPDSSYHLAYLFSYPTKADAKRGVADGIISSAEAAKIDAAQDACTEPPQETGLGGAIEIHGAGSSKDWTAGCVGLESADIDVLWGTLGLNDTIVVLP